MKQSLLVAAMLAVALSACGKKEGTLDASDVAASVPAVEVTEVIASTPAPVVDINVNAASAPVEAHVAH